MDTFWKLDTRGDPLAIIAQFIQILWISEKLDMMIVSPDGHAPILESPEETSLIHPFHPLMEINLARRVSETLNSNPGKRIGILLRPCELRAMKELASRGAFRLDDLFVICFDCLGTYPVDEVRWREERLALTRSITEESLKFAPQGGIASYRYRPACQVCENPGATDGIVNLGVIGLPVRQEILVQGRSKDVQLEAITNGNASEDLVLKREKMLERIMERHQHTRALMIRDLDAYLPDSLDALIDHLQACEGCHQCLDACPLCSVDYPRRSSDGRLVKEDMINWLVSCAGCGMCEQACPKALPLTTMFNRVRDQLQIELTH